MFLLALMYFRIMNQLTRLRTLLGGDSSLGALQVGTGRGAGPSLGLAASTMAAMTAERRAMVASEANKLRREGAKALANAKASAGFAAKHARQTALDTAARMAAIRAERRRVRRNEGALRFQSLYRGFVVRKTINELRVRRRAHQEFSDLRVYAATRIQSFFRGHCARRLAKAKKTELENFIKCARAREGRAPARVGAWTLTSPPRARSLPRPAPPRPAPAQVLPRHGGGRRAQRVLQPEPDEALLQEPRDPAARGRGGHSAHDHRAGAPARRRRDRAAPRRHGEEGPDPQVRQPQEDGKGRRGQVQGAGALASARARARARARAIAPIRVPIRLSPHTSPAPHRALSLPRPPAYRAQLAFERAEDADQAKYLQSVKEVEARAKAAALRQKAIDRGMHVSQQAVLPLSEVIADEDMGANRADELDLDRPGRDPLFFPLRDPKVYLPVGKDRLRSLMAQGYASATARAFAAEKNSEFETGESGA
jgi:hypothetical protein